MISLYSPSIQSQDTRQNSMEWKRSFQNIPEYHRHVMQLYSDLKNRKRQQRRQDIWGIRQQNLGTLIDSSSRYSKFSLPPRRRRKCVGINQAAIGLRSSIMTQSSADNYFLLLQNGSRDNSSFCEFKNDGYSMQSTPWGLSMKNSAESVNSVTRSRDTKDVVSSSNYKLSAELENIWKITKQNLDYAQSSLIRAILPKLAILLNFGFPTEKIASTRQRHFKSIQAITLNDGFVELIQNSNNETKITTQSREELIITNIPIWEQRFLGLRTFQQRRRTVIAYRKPSSDVKLWLSRC